MERHIPVLVQEVAGRLVKEPTGTYVDGTIGSGGHSEYLLRNFKDIRIIGLDVDGEALERARENLQDYTSRVQLIKSNFQDIKNVLRKLGVTGVSGIFLDLGVSREQLETKERGFSYREDGPLDMRFDQEKGLTAGEIVNRYPAEELEKFFREFGEERFARKIARAIVRQRRIAPLNTTRQLADLIARTVPGYEKSQHPARRVFQALRIFVNKELAVLNHFLQVLPEILLPGGRAVIVSYHSGEDRLVKTSFRQGEQKGYYRIVKPFLVRPTGEEVENNPRARSARLRAVERI